MKHLIIIALIVLTSCSSKKEIMKENTIDGTWIVNTLQEISETTLNSNKTKPFIRIEGTKITGNNGCNTIMTSFSEVSKNTFVINLIAETRMFCPQMKIPNTFNSLLKESVSYKISGNTLTFLDKNNQTTITFNKKQ